MSDDLQPPDMTTWQRLFDDQAYWQNSPDAHYLDLQRIADDLLGQGVHDVLAPSRDRQAVWKLDQ